MIIAIVVLCCIATLNLFGIILQIRAHRNRPHQ